MNNDIAYVHDNDIYHVTFTAGGSKVRRLTENGVPGIIYNGIPDWVYEGKDRTGISTLETHFRLMRDISVSRFKSHLESCALREIRTS